MKTQNLWSTVGGFLGFLTDDHQGAQVASFVALGHRPDLGHAGGGWFTPNGCSCSWKLAGECFLKFGKDGGKGFTKKRARDVVGGRSL